VAWGGDPLEAAAAVSLRISFDQGEQIGKGRTIDFRPDLLALSAWPSRCFSGFIATGRFSVWTFSVMRLPST
jgi:hypothetical protein